MKIPTILNSKLKLALVGLVFAGTAGAAATTGPVRDAFQKQPTSIVTPAPAENHGPDADKPNITTPSDNGAPAAVDPDTNVGVTTPAAQPQPKPAPKPVDNTHYSQPGPGHTCRWHEWDGPNGDVVYYVDDSKCPAAPTPTPQPQPDPTPTPDPTPCAVCVPNEN